MKLVWLVVTGALYLGPGAGGALGQAVNTDSLRRARRAEIERYRAQAAAAAAVFLDRTRAPAERLAAVRETSGFVEPQQVDGCVAVALNQAEPIAVRVRALQLVGHRVDADTSVAQRVFVIATDTTAPAELRSEAVTQLALASFALPQSFVRPLRAAARDPDIRIRRSALRALAGHGDPPTLDMLAAGLSSPTEALLPPSEAVQLLGLKDPAPFYPLLHRLMLQPPDSATRLVAIQLLGRYGPSRGTIALFLRDSKEAPAVRQAALGALAAGDPRGLPQQVLPVVADEAAPLDLRLRAIKAVEVARTSRDPKVFARAPDAFDRLMERLAERSPSLAVREAARTYLSRTRSAR